MSIKHNQNFKKLKILNKNYPDYIGDVKKRFIINLLFYLA